MPPKAVPPKAPPTCVLKENAKKLESEVAEKDGLKLVLSFFVELDRFMLPLRRLYRWRHWWKRAPRTRV